MVNFKIGIVPYLEDLKQSSLNFTAVFTNNNFLDLDPEYFINVKGIASLFKVIGSS